MKLKLSLVISLLLFLSAEFSLSAQQPDDIIGQWISKQRNFIVEIYRGSNEFRGKIVWFDDSDDRSQPMNLRTDISNPVKSLRKRKLIGLDVLKGLTYNIKCRCWQNGKIYDTRTGRTWSASITLVNLNVISVRGYWHYEFIGKSMTFRRVK